MQATNAFDEGENARRLLLPQRARDAISADLTDPGRHAAAQASLSEFVEPYRRADGTLVRGYRKPDR